MPFSDRPPALVFPDCTEGRVERAKTVAEEFEMLSQSVIVCGDFVRTKHPIFTDDDFYRPRHIPVCSRRKRDGVRDMNWCCRCMAGFPHMWLDKHDEDSLRDISTI